MPKHDRSPTWSRDLRANKKQQHTITLEPSTWTIYHRNRLNIQLQRGRYSPIAAATLSTGTSFAFPYNKESYSILISTVTADHSSLPAAHHRDNLLVSVASMCEKLQDSGHLNDQPDLHSLGFYFARTTLLYLYFRVLLPQTGGEYLDRNVEEHTEQSVIPTP
jgi:hypothetical protein